MSEFGTLDKKKRFGSKNINYLIISHNKLTTPLIANQQSLIINTEDILQKAVHKLIQIIKDYNLII